MPHPSAIIAGTAETVLAAAGAIAHVAQAVASGLRCLLSAIGRSS